MSDSEKLSRRLFLTNAGRITVAATAGAAGLSVIAASQGQNLAAAEVPEWPWPYKKLDPEAVYWKGVSEYYKSACSQGAFWAIISELGHPFTTVPVGMLKWGEGGVTGWGSHCGALIGASSAVALIHKDSAVYTKIISELTGWYTEDLGSGSPLCHVSVTEWAKENNVLVDSQERKDRCARVTGEVAKKAVLLLNAQADGLFKAAFAPRSSVAECQTCHGKGAREEVRAGVVQDCRPCHGDAHKASR